MRPASCSLRTADRPAVLVAGSCVGVNVLLALLGMIAPIPSWVMWPAAILGSAVGGVGCLIAGLTGPGRVSTFWKRLAVAATLMTAGTVGWAYDMLTGDGVAINPVTNAFFLAAIGVAVVALLRLPGRRRTRRGTVALWLDIAVVTVAAILAAGQLVAGTDMPGVRGVLATAMYAVILGTCGATVVAVIKVGMAGAEPIHPPSIWTLAPIGLLAPVMFVLTPFMQPWPHLNPTVLSLPMAGLLFTLASRAQVQANRVPRGPATQPLPTDRPHRPSVWRRSINVVPYLAVGLTVAMVVAVVLRTGSLPATLAIGAVMLIVLVVIRQLLALADNTELLDRLSEQAEHDDLTGLPNRRFFTAALTNRTANTTVAVCDLDGFAALNDRLGDDCGDAILRQAAARITLTIDGGAVVARLMSDEFGILLPAGHDLAEGPQLADALQHAFRAPLRVDDRDLLVTATVGVATGAGADVPDLLRRAELALAAAARAGGNRHRAYTIDLDAGAEHHAQMAADIRRGLDHGEFRLVYQPIVRLPHGDIHGVEALVRWHPDGGSPISPGDFIPVAEHTGLIIDLGAWIIDRACADAAGWQRRHGGAAPWISVNVSARQLLDPELPAIVSTALTRHGLDPRRLTLEITETAVFAGGAAMATVQALRDLGSGIALDDFGTGHSSLTLLRTCPVTTLKVDKSFIDGLNGTAQQEAIATSLSGIASTLGLRAVAEGVENGDQAARLHELGYRYAQGFHFARPGP
ncbi:putative bifunctional diguanylate cyclase/phosphodiesterase, partial [Paractinoplanes rishiriensis]|uniref:putative bifunctional diguanylate cyclase/phosphodiesterase n=1 Tax=Paractinoplanes rishiriensis TaxID=1050105 RepID=UPI001942FFA4